MSDLFKGAHLKKSASELLTPEDLANRWGLSPNTLANWRALKRGPSYIKLSMGRSPIRYRLEDVLAFEESCVIDPEKKKR